MKILKIVLVVLLGYVAIVVAFESLIGILQPKNQSTLVITTTDDSGASKDRVLARLESDGHMYVAANHWPRAWYRQALAHPNVEVDVDGKKAPYVAVPVTGAEHDRVQADNPVGFGFRLLTGFPPRYFLRLDPR
jgi:uncharacterized lipoprotein